VSIIVGPDGDRRDLVSAVESGGISAVVAAIRTVVALSVKSHPMREGMTGAELKRRADIAIRWFERLRGDLGWSVDRALSATHSALTAELDGREYVPDTEAVMWKPNEALEPFAAVLRAEREAADPLAARALN
jgi:hypothetical protein